MAVELMCQVQQQLQQELQVLAVVVMAHKMLPLMLELQTLAAVLGVQLIPEFKQQQQAAAAL